ncbi:AAA family ATPase [Flammeovirga kamogawensis]|uniref:AAA family ATPase n=1 Tax=Flammeovirga kamogawensis TaxID=373891 RepID=A0ABX8H4Q3_9BACT|nr:AAA family ATPase [Flammeovirga kamogawensis]MBB6463875.1 cellulose biosynthesis protein BcsQ [Flammeovirga kamogawensis]QWG10796.1 AAA family ATPase [Flammeovirga kamogawensis]TRX63217.1 AAA family ATPase [Flammeovirga kamogawensis]
MSTLIDNIKYFRKEKGLSQKEVAAKSEISLATYQRIEQGTTDVGMTDLSKISDVLGIGVDTLMKRRCTIITLANTKGGSGKTTMAIHISKQLKLLTGKKVLAFDTDIQESLSNVHSDDSIVDLVTFDHTKKFVSKESSIRTQLVNLSKEYDYIIIDTAGSFESFTFLSAIIEMSNILIVPFQLTRMSISGTEFIEELIVETNAHRSEQGKLPTKAVAVATMVNKRANEVKILKDIEFEGINVLTNVISNSVEYSRTDDLSTSFTNASIKKEFDKFMDELEKYTGLSN